MLNFILEADQVVLHCICIFMLDVDSGVRPCISLGSRDPSAVVGREILPLFVVCLLVGDLLQVHLLWLKDSFSSLPMRGLRSRRHGENCADWVDRYVAEPP